MAPGFAFPPPPPPPPKQNEDASASNFQDGFRGGHGHAGSGRGGRGRGQMHAQHVAGDRYTQSTPLSSPSASPSFTTDEHERKRKRDVAAGGSWRGAHNAQRQPHPMKPRTSAPKPEVAPAVPSFGAPFAFATPPSGLSAGVPSSGVKLFGQGLGQPIDQDVALKQDSSEGDSEDDEDEERTLSMALGSAERLRFEHDGDIIVLDTTRDLQEWQKERRQNWPNDRYIAQKYEERLARTQERRRIEAETDALVYGASVAKPNPPSTSAGQSAPLSRAEELRSQLLRQKESRHGASDSLLLDSMGTKPADTGPAKHGNGTAIPGMGDYGDSSSEAGSTSDEAPDPNVAKAEELVSDLDSSSQPEVQTTKPAAGHAHAAEFSTRICDEFSRRGRCKFGDNCRYQHVRPDLDPITLQPKAPRHRKQASTKNSSTRKTLHQRLVEQEQHAENKLAVQAIKYLGSIGFFRPQANE